MGICLFLRLESTSFILRFFPLVIYSTILRIYFLDPFINLMSKSLTFISILRSFIIVQISLAFLNLFMLFILSPSVSLFVVSFIKYILTSCFPLTRLFSSILFTIFSFFVSTFIYGLSRISCSTNSFQNFFCHFCFLCFSFFLSFFIYFFYFLFLSSSVSVSILFINFISSFMLTLSIILNQSITSFTFSSFIVLT